MNPLLRWTSGTIKELFYFSSSSSKQQQKRVLLYEKYGSKLGYFNSGVHIVSLSVACCHVRVVAPRARFLFPVPGVSTKPSSHFPPRSKTAMNNMSVPHSVIHSSNFTNPDEAEDGGRKKDSGDVPKPKVRKVEKRVHNRTETQKCQSAE